HTSELRHVEISYAVFCLKKIRRVLDRKSTRLNSSHVEISYAVFCLKKHSRAGHGRPRPSRTTRRALRASHPVLALPGHRPISFFFMGAAPPGTRPLPPHRRPPR